MLDVVDLGDNHKLKYSNYDGQSRVACSIQHLTPQGKPCNGFIAFENRAWANAFKPDAITTWKIEQEDPLTLSLSILCRVCGDHGHVTNGKWIKCE